MVKASMLVAPVTMLAFNKYGQELQIDHIRLAFATVVCAIAGLLFLLNRAVRQSREQQPIEFEVKTPGKPTEKKTLPAAKYDAEEFMRLIKRLLPGIAIVTALHCWKGFAQPLVIQCVTMPLTLFESPLFQVYLLGRAATGSLARPWKEDNPFAALTGAATDTAAEPVAAASNPTSTSATQDKAAVQEAIDKVN